VLGESDGSGRTLLHLCATWPCNAVEAVQSLLKASASAEAADAFGRTPLEAAAESAAAREDEDPGAALDLVSVLFAAAPKPPVFLAKQTASTAIGAAVLALLRDLGATVQLEGEKEEPEPASQEVSAPKRA
ncbi:unnamed protein product, partial [Effrenium voratum]